MNENIQIMKLTYYWTPLGQKNYDTHHEINCPCCGFENETIEYMYRCPDQRMATARDTVINTMSKYGASENTPCTARLLHHPQPSPRIL